MNSFSLVRMEVNDFIVSSCLHNLYCLASCQEVLQSNKIECVSLHELNGRQKGRGWANELEMFCSSCRWLLPCCISIIANFYDYDTLGAKCLCQWQLISAAISVPVWWSSTWGYAPLKYFEWAFAGHFGKRLDLQLCWIWIWIPSGVTDQPESRQFRPPFVNAGPILSRGSVV